MVTVNVGGRTERRPGSQNQANVRFVIIHHEILSEYPHWGNSFFILCWNTINPFTHLAVLSSSSMRLWCGDTRGQHYKGGGDERLRKITRRRLIPHRIVQYVQPKAPKKTFTILIMRHKLVDLCDALSRHWLLFNPNHQIIPYRPIESFTRWLSGTKQWKEWNLKYTTLVTLLYKNPSARMQPKKDILCFRVGHSNYILFGYTYRPFILACYWTNPSQLGQINQQNMVKV